MPSFTKYSKKFNLLCCLKYYTKQLMFNLLFCVFWGFFSTRLNVILSRRKATNDPIQVEIQGGKPTSYKTVKKTIEFCEKGPFKSVSCCRFPFQKKKKKKKKKKKRKIKKKQDRLRQCSKKQDIYIGKHDA